MIIIYAIYDGINSLLEFWYFYRDNVEWDQELLEQAEEKIKKNSQNLLPKEKAGKIKLAIIINFLILKVLFWYSKMITKIMPTCIGINFIQFTRISFSRIVTGCSLNFLSF